MTAVEVYIELSIEHEVASLKYVAIFEVCLSLLQLYVCSCLQASELKCANEMMRLIKLELNRLAYNLLSPF